MTLPVALTCGDPNGIGLDITLDIVRNGIDIPFFLIGDVNHIALRAPSLDIIRIENAGDYKENDNGSISILHHPFSTAPNLKGEQPENAQDIIDVIERAVDLAMTGQVSAICTNPIHKAVLKNGAGFNFPGHTEFLAHLGGVERSVMMLASEMLRSVPVTIHNALSEVPQLLTPSLIKETITITHQALRDNFGIMEPRIAIAGLNPHAGESGTFGREEVDMIIPLIQNLRNSGIDALGPYSADTMFHTEAREHYDVAICMYHDQALIPIKTLDFHGGVNITLGLPFIRTSPDHGTAFDLAGSKRANSTSLRNALTTAFKMAQ